jgi:hypothetical protein
MFQRGPGEAVRQAARPRNDMVTCMNNKMSSNETLSITAWEKTHPTEVAACDKESGWK